MKLSIADYLLPDAQAILADLAPDLADRKNPDDFVDVNNEDDAILQDLLNARGLSTVDLKQGLQAAQVPASIELLNGNAVLWEAKCHGTAAKLIGDTIDGLQLNKGDFIVISNFIAAHAVLPDMPTPVIAMPAAGPLLGEPFQLKGINSDALSIQLPRDEHAILNHAWMQPGLSLHQAGAAFELRPHETNLLACNLRILPEKISATDTPPRPLPDAPAELLGLKVFTPDECQRLAAANVCTAEDVAWLDYDDLMKILPDVTDDRAEAIIMPLRKPLLDAMAAAEQAKTEPAAPAPEPRPLPPANKPTVKRGRGRRRSTTGSIGKPSLSKNFVPHELPAAELAGMLTSIQQKLFRADWIDQMVNLVHLTRKYHLSADDIYNAAYTLDMRMDRKPGRRSDIPAGTQGTTDLAAPAAPKPDEPASRNSFDQRRATFHAQLVNMLDNKLIHDFDVESLPHGMLSLTDAAYNKALLLNSGFVKITIDPTPKDTEQLPPPQGIYWHEASGIMAHLLAEGRTRLAVGLVDWDGDSRGVNLFPNPVCYKLNYGKPDDIVLPITVYQGAIEGMLYKGMQRIHDVVADGRTAIAPVLLPARVESWGDILFAANTYHAFHHVKGGRKPYSEKIKAGGQMDLTKDAINRLAPPQRPKSIDLYTNNTLYKEQRQ